MSPPSAKLWPLEGRRPPPSGWGAWLAAAVGALCFLNTLGNGFVYDDLPIVRENPRIRSLANVRSIWLSDWWRPLTPEEDVQQKYRDRLYRPLTMYTYALNYAAGGPAPAGYHGGNILLHAAVCFLVWHLAQRLIGQPALANVGALVFAVHPVHCEAVASVVGRAEVLAGLFLLLGLLLLLPAARPADWRRAAAAAVPFLAALFSKETAVCYVPIALMALHAAAKRPEGRVGRWWLMHTAILLVPLVIYLPLRYAALDHHLLRDLPPYVGMNPLVWASPLRRWMLALTILGHYARLLIAPVNLSCNYGLAVIDPDGGPELPTLVGLLTAVAGVAALGGYWRRSLTWRQLAVLVAMSSASYALISNTVLLIGVSLAERLVYWPSVPMLLALVAAVLFLWRQATESGRLSADVARLVRICGVLLLVALGLRSFVRNMDWFSNGTLFMRDVQTYPQSAELNEAAANELLWELQRISETGRPQDVSPQLHQADRFLTAALKINPQSVPAMQMRGRVLGMLGERDAAIVYFERAAALGPLDHVSQRLLGVLRDEAHQEAVHVAELAERVSTRPTDADVRREYAEVLMGLGRYSEALSELEEAARLAPENGEVLRLLGETYAAMNEGERAIETLKRAVQAAPGDWRIQHNLAVLLSGSEPEAALRYAQEAYRLAPSTQTSLTLAEALAINKRTREALERFRELVKALPEDDPLRPAIEARIRDLEHGRP